MGEDLPAVDLGTGRTARAVVAADTHACALLDNGQVKCWGNNAGEVLGLEDTVNRAAGQGQMGDALPAVDLGAGRTATAITAGRSHTCALLDTGQVKWWGLGTYGRLGYGDTVSRGASPGDMGDDLPAVDLGDTGVTGTISRSGTTAGLSEVWVAVLRQSDFGLDAAGATGSDGRFRIATPPGEYFVYLLDPPPTTSPGSSAPRPR